MSCAFGAKGGACLTGCYKGAGCKYVTSGRYGRQARYLQYSGGVPQVRSTRRAAGTLAAQGCHSWPPTNNNSGTPTPQTCHCHATSCSLATILFNLSMRKLQVSIIPGSHVCPVLTTLLPRPFSSPSNHLCQLRRRPHVWLNGAANPRPLLKGIRHRKRLRLAELVACKSWSIGHVRACAVPGLPHRRVVG